MKTHEKHIPKLILLEGSSGTGKTNTCLRELEEEIRISKDPLQSNLLYLLPTLEHRERIADVLLRRSISGFFHRLITTFDDVLKSSLKLGGINFASDISRYLIVKDLIGACSFEYFKEAARTKGFVGLVSALVTEFKESLLDSDDLRKRLQILEQKFPLSKNKYQEIFSLCSTYEKRLQEAGLKDRHDALFLLEEGLKRGEWQFPRYHKIWIDGFFDFSKLQFAFIRFLAAHADQITITLTLDSVRPALFQIPAQTRKALLDIGFKAEKLPPKNQRTGEKALTHLETNLFSEAKYKEEKSGFTVQILESTGLAGELEMIAREIKTIVRSEAGVNYSDIALIFRQLGPYANIIRSVFAQFEIPVEIHEREELRLNPLARTVVSLLRICLHDWNREDLFNFLKSSFIRRDYEKICEAEIRACQLGVFKGRDYWAKLLALPEIKLLAGFHAQFEVVKSASDFVRIVKRAYDSFGLNLLPKELNEQNKRNHAALKRLYLLLDELEFKYGDATLEPAHLAEIFLQLIEVDLFSFHHRDKNKVQVYTVSLARQKEYRFVFIPGLLEKQFPVQIKEDPILSDEERKVFNAGEDVLQERLPRQTMERFLFYIAVTRAKEKLYLSYPRFDLEGKEALPSFYVEEANVLFESGLQKKRQPISEILPPLQIAAREKEAFAHVLYHLWQTPERKRSVEEEKLYVSLYNALLGREDFCQVLRRLFIPIEGRISDERIIPFIKPDKAIYTPTKLEEYAECAYRYFADQVLRLQSFEDKIDARVVGTILHNVLEEFHIWAKQKGHEKIDIESAKSKCDELLAEGLERNPLLGDRWYKVELKKREIREMIHQILIQEFVKAKPPISGLHPEHFEFEFGFKGGAPPLVLKTERGDVQFRGKIDRIDVDGSGKFGLVIDYKMGKSFDKNALERGTELQLPLYILAMEQNLGLKPLGAHLYQMSSATSKGFHHLPNLEEAGLQTKKHNKLSGEEWHQRFEKLLFQIARYVEQIEKGEIPVRPRDCVDFCPYSSMCRIEKWRLPDIYEEIKTEDTKIWQERVQHERI